MPIETQKHVPPGGAAVDGDEERAVAAAGVVALDVGALEEDAVLDRDRVQVARAHAEQRERPLRRRLLDELRCAAVVAAARLPEPHARGQQVALPRVRADRVAEARLVGAALEAVACPASCTSVQPAGSSSAEAISS